jgi:23S rRNA pseudouridine1911/1915/1917 synthase
MPADLRAVGRLERPFLHAARLSFKHPTDGRKMDFSTPLSADLQSILDELRSRAGH